MLERSIVDQRKSIVFKGQTRTTLVLISLDREGNRPPNFCAEHALLHKFLWFGSSRHHHHNLHCHRFLSAHAHHLRGHLRDRAHTLAYHTQASSSSILCRSVSRNDEPSLRALCQQGRIDAALGVLAHMDRPPSTASYLDLLKECNRRKSLAHAKQVQAHLAQFTGAVTDLLGDYLVMTLANCGSVKDALLVSTNLPCLTVFSWTAIISAYVDHGCGQEALEMYDCMQEAFVEPNSYTFVSLFRACSNIPDLKRGKELHKNARRNGFGSDLFVGTALLSMYSKCGAIPEAEEVFGSLSKLDVVCCNAMLSAYVDNGQGEKALLLYRQTVAEGIGVDECTIVVALQACGLFANKKETYTEYESSVSIALEIGRALHIEAQRKGYTSDHFVDSALVSMYGRCGSIMEAEHFFCEWFDKDTASWNAMFSAYIETDQEEKALQLYKHIQEQGISANQLTYVIMLQACGTLLEKEGTSREIIEMYLKIGHALHCDVCKNGYVSDVRVGTALINMYSKCRRVSEASAMFSSLSQRDTVSWNAMLTALVEQGQEKRALQLYRQMHEEGAMANQLTFVMALQACVSLAENEEAVVLKERTIKVIALDIGQALHSDARRKGYASDVLVGNTLLSMYCRSCAILEAENVLYALSQWDIVSWNVILSAYVEQGQGERVFQIFQKLQADQILPDNVTYSCILQACCDIGNLEILWQLHFGIVCAGFENIMSVASSLLHAYGGCARMVDLEAIFDTLPKPDLVLWNTCIAGHAAEGNCVESLQAMEKLELTGFKPDAVSFSSLLVACTHTGLVAEGLKHFISMSIFYGIPPDLTHYGNVVDLLGRAGGFKRLENMLGRMMGKFDLSKFVCMLSACRIHNNIALARWAFDQAVNIQPNQVAIYVLMSNICADFQLQENACPAI